MLFWINNWTICPPRNSCTFLTSSSSQSQFPQNSVGMQQQPCFIPSIINNWQDEIPPHLFLSSKGILFLCEMATGVYAELFLYLLPFNHYSLIHHQHFCVSTFLSGVFKCEYVHRTRDYVSHRKNTDIFPSTKQRFFLSEVIFSQKVFSPFPFSQNRQNLRDKARL